MLSWCSLRSSKSRQRQSSARHISSTQQARCVLQPSAGAVLGSGSFGGWTSAAQLCSASSGHLLPLRQLSACLLPAELVSIQCCGIWSLCLVLATTEDRSG